MTLEAIQHNLIGDPAVKFLDRLSCRNVRGSVNQSRSRRCGRLRVLVFQIQSHNIEHMSDLELRLRRLPAFPEPLPVLSIEDLPTSPDQLFLAWLTEAIESGSRQPHAMTMLTVRADGAPVGRTLILKDVDDEGYHFSTHRSSRKGIEIATNSRISMVFFWRESGRQVRITGEAVPLDENASQSDWSARPSYRGAPNPDWQRYALKPSEFEFMQARLDRNHTRIEYLRDGQGWAHAPVLTPAG